MIYCHWRNALLSLALLQTVVMEPDIVAHTHEVTFLPRLVKFVYLCFISKNFLSLAFCYLMHMDYSINITKGRK